MIIVPITSLTTTPNQNSTITTDDDYKTMAIGDLMKLRINRSITTPIKTHTITPNIVRTNIVFATLINILK